MNAKDLGRLLGEMYNKAPHGDQVAMIHLFGVRYAEVITKNNLSVKEIVDVAGIRPSYSAEVSKGIRLSRYVVPKD